MTIDTTAPAAPSFALDAASDTGTLGDNLTTDTTPTLTGTAEANATIEVFDGATSLGTTTATGGTWSFTSGVLAGGVHNLTAKATDVAGNTSAASAIVALTIDTANVAPVLDTDKTVVMPEDGGQIALGIAAPTDADTGDTLSIVVTAVPGNGTIFKADGTTAVANAATLTLAELQGLKFTAGAVTANTTDSFTYTVSDGTNAAVVGTVTLTVNETSVAVNETIAGAAGDDVLIGGAGNDQLTGNAGADTYYASAGVDTIIGGTGADTLIIGTQFFVEGAKTDTTTGDVTFTYVDDADATHTVTIQDQLTAPISSVQFDLDEDGALETFSLDVTADTTGGLTLTAATAGATAIAGTDGVDTIVGGAGNDALLGNAGNDTITGLGGNDFLDGGLGDDIIDGGAGTDTATFHDATTSVTVDLSAAANAAVGSGTATGGGGTDTLIGIENLEGGFGNDVLTGDAGANKLIGLEGDDTITGGGGDDFLEGDVGNDVIDGGAGTGDWALYGSATGSVIADLRDNNSQDAVIIADGFSGFDTLINIENIQSGSGADQLFGDANANVLQAGSGDDILTGGAGADTLKGETGADTFVYRAISDSTTTVVDTIADFSGADGDKIDISLLVQGTFAYLGAAAFSVNTGNTQARFDDAGNQLQIDVNGSGTADMFINMTAVTVATFGSSFILASSPITGVDSNGATVETLTGGVGVDLFVATLGDDEIVTGGGNDRLRIDTDIFLEGAELIGTDLVFSVSDDTNAYTTTVTNHTTAPLTEIIFDADEDGTLDTYQVATSFDVSTSVLDTVMAGTSAGEAITGGYGDDILLGNGGIDTLNGGAGDDRLEGGLGDDVIIGGANLNHGDTVTFHNASAAVVVDLSATANTLVGSGTATGADGSDTLTGIENIEGSGFIDTITGDAGDNLITGLEGADILLGGSGADVFIYESTFDSGVSAGDTIGDFDAGTSTTAVDTIDLSSLVTGTFTYLGLTDGTTNAFTGGSTGNTEARFNDSTKLLEIDADGDATVDMEIELTTTDGTLLDDSDFITSHVS